MAGYINKHLFNAENKFFCDSENIARSLTQTVLQYDKFLLNFTYGMVNNDFPSKIVKSEFVLDYDCYSLNVLNGNIIDEYIQEYHGAIKELFEQSIDKKLKAIMGEIAS